MKLLYLEFQIIHIIPYGLEISGSEFKDKNDYQMKFHVESLPGINYFNYKKRNMSLKNIKLGYCIKHYFKKRIFKDFLKILQKKI